MLTWKRRRQREDTLIARHLIRESTCGDYRTVASTPLLESLGHETAYYAMYLKPHGRDLATWTILSRHKSEAAAMTACEWHTGQ